MITIEGAVYWLLLIDCITYSLLTATKGKFHDMACHAWGEKFPLKPMFAIWYLALMVWLGSNLTRTGILPGF